MTLTRTATGYLLESPALPGWSAHAHDLTSLRNAVGRAFTEHEVANYARFRGTTYDVHQLEQEVPRQVAARQHPAEPDPEPPAIGWAKDATVRPDTHHPAEWTPLPDGRWRSPKGNTYRPDTAMVAAVCQRREQLGLPVSA